MPRAATLLLVADHTTSNPAMDFHHLSFSTATKKSRTVCRYREVTTNTPGGHTLSPEYAPSLPSLFPDDNYNIEPQHRF
jgi:hypothetical protein